MTAFELLAYVVAFILCVSTILTIVFVIVMLVERDRAVKDYELRKGGGILNGNKSNKEK